MSSDLVVASPSAPSTDAAGDVRALSAGELVHRRLVQQVALLHRHESGIRRGVPDSVHQARVSCRRLRAALATFHPLFDRTVTEPVREELRWLAGALGEARDAEVMHERLRRLVEEEPFVEGPVRARLRRTYLARARQGNRDADEVMGSERHSALLRALEELVDDPPWTARATGDAHRLVESRLRTERRRLERRVEAAYAPGLAAAARDRAVHDARKAAKRYRYAWEAAVPVLGQQAETAVAQARGLTRLLGDRQDSTMTRAHLEQLARDATDAGECASTYRRLHDREDQQARRLDEEFLRRWRAFAQNS